MWKGGQDVNLLIRWISWYAFPGEARAVPRLRQRAGWDFPGGAVAKTQLPVGGAEVRSLVRENPHAATETQCSQIIFF